MRNETITAIENFLLDFFNKNMKDYIDIFKNYIDAQSSRVAKLLYEFQQDEVIKYKGDLIFQDKEEDFKKLIRKKLNDALSAKAELYCLKNSAIFISEPIRKQFSEFLLLLFEKTLESENIKKVFQDAASKLFTNLNTKMNPEIIPIEIAPMISTLAHPAVIATKPAKEPFNVIETSGLPFFIQVIIITVTVASDAETVVVMNT